MFVDGKLVHSKKVSKGPEQGGRVGLGSWEGGKHMSVHFALCAQKGDGFVDEARLEKIVNIINEEIRKRQQATGELEVS